MHTTFHWITFDVQDLLPHSWQDDAIAAAYEADCREFPRTPLLSREGPEVHTIFRGRVHADQVRRRLPWLYGLYREQLPELISVEWPEPIYPAVDDRYGVVLNVQRGTGMRFEAHIDSNPVSALLFFTNHPEGGGELAVSHDLDARDVAAIDLDCSVIPPHAGHLVVFDGRDRPHYARPLFAESDVRILAVMNYYTKSCPESARPRELNRHLYGDPS